MTVLDTACSLRSWREKDFSLSHIVAQVLPCSALFVRHFYMCSSASFEVVEVAKPFIFSEIKVLKSWKPWPHGSERNSPVIMTPEVLSP